MQYCLEPEDMALLIKVVDEACIQLGGCDESTKSIIATRILCHSYRGKRDYERSLAIALYGAPERLDGHRKSEE